MEYSELLSKFCPSINRLCQGRGCMAYHGDEDNGECVEYFGHPVGNGAGKLTDRLRADNPAEATQTEAVA
jgi:hypothetical protein